MADPDPDQGSADRTFPWRWLVVVPIAILGLLLLAYYAGMIGRPAVGIADRGDWGTVTDERTEIVTTVWVNNPNPVGATFGPGMHVTYDVRLNGVLVAAGAKENIDVPAGNSTEQVHTYVTNDRLPEWWVAFLRANETVRADFRAHFVVDVGPSVNYTVERHRTMMADSRPVTGAFDGVADRMEGRYVHNVSVAGDVRERLREFGIDPGRQVTVGYAVRRADARLASVTANRTTVVYRLRVHNPGDVPVPASPRGIRLTVAANDVRLFEANRTTLSVRNLSSDEVLRPGETRVVTFAVTMDNDRVDEWFTSHVRRGERSTVTARFRLVFENPVTGDRIRLPTDGPATYDCQFRTAILVDDRTAGTDCQGANATVGG